MQNDTSLDATLRRLDEIAFAIARVERYNFPKYLPELRSIVALLEYYAQPKEGIGPPTTPFFGPQPSCQHDGCMITWKDHDACLLNFNGRWLCREHHPPLNDGGIRPPGYQPPSQEREDLEANRQAVRAKLSREELRYINTRIGG